MKCLYVLFDAECALCQRCRDWLARQPAYIRLIFIPLQSPDLSRRFPGIEALHPSEQLLVVNDAGAVYRGANSWIMCLYATRDYREWSQRLATPTLLPWARRVCELLSQHRLSFSRRLALKSPAEISARLKMHNVGPLAQTGGSAACALSENPHPGRGCGRLEIPESFHAFRPYAQSGCGRDQRAAAVVRSRFPDRGCGEDARSFAITLGTGFKRAIHIGLGVETPERKAKAAFRPFFRQLHRAQDVGRLERTGATGGTGRATEVMAIQEDERRLRFDSGEGEAGGVRQTLGSRAVHEHVRTLSRAASLQSDRASARTRVCSSSIAAAAHSAAFPNPTIEATFSVPARRLFS